MALTPNDITVPLSYGLLVIIRCEPTWGELDGVQRLAGDLDGGDVVASGSIQHHEAPHSGAYHNSLATGIKGHGQARFLHSQGSLSAYHKY